MRWFWIAIVIATLAALDRALMDGQNTDFAMGVARTAGNFLSKQLDELSFHLRK